MSWERGSVANGDRAQWLCQVQMEDSKAKRKHPPCLLKKCVSRQSSSDFTNFRLFKILSEITTGHFISWKIVATQVGDQYTLM